MFTAIVFGTVLCARLSATQAELLDETCQVEVVGSAAEAEAGLRLCAELRL
jgi:hypothetical protein